MKLRVAQAADRAFERALFMSLHAKALAGLPESLRAPLLAQQWRAREHGYAAQYPDLQREIICVAEQSVGYLLSAPEDGGLRLVDIAMLPAQRRCGIARAAIEQLCQRAAPGAVRLRVDHDNHAALRLYRTLGFQACGQDELSLQMERPSD